MRPPIIATPFSVRIITRLPFPLLCAMLPQQVGMLIADHKTAFLMGNDESSQIPVALQQWTAETVAARMH